MNAQKGFTLIELMIVVAIIGILAAIAIPAYQDYIARSQMSEAMTLTSGLKGAVSETFSQDGSCPENGDSGIAVASTIKGKYVASVETGEDDGACTITATMADSGVSSGIQGETLTLTMTNNEGSLDWACSSSAAQKYVPKACVGQ